MASSNPKKRKVPETTHIPHLTQSQLGYIYQFSVNSKTWDEVKEHFFPPIDTSGISLVGYTLLEDGGFGPIAEKHYFWLTAEELKAIEDSELCFPGGGVADDTIQFNNLWIYKNIPDICLIWNKLSKESKTDSVDLGDSIFSRPIRPGYMYNAEFDKRQKELGHSLDRDENDVSSKIKALIEQLPEIKPGLV